MPFSILSKTIFVIVLCVCTVTELRIPALLAGLAPACGFVAGTVWTADAFLEKGTKSERAKMRVNGTINRFMRVSFAKKPIRKTGICVRKAGNSKEFYFHLNFY